MEFEETDKVLTFHICDKYFIYFLLRGNEVVYVGQTTAGLSRPFSHQDKEYDLIKVLPCSPDELDEKEDYYINKYKPIYNKMRNYNVVYTLKRVKKLIRDYYNPKFNLWGLRKALAVLNIEPFLDEYTGCLCVTCEQYHEIENYIKRSNN